MVFMKRVLAFTLLVLLSVVPLATGHAMIHDESSPHQQAADSVFDTDARHADASCSDEGCDSHDRFMCCAALAAFCNSLAIAEDQGTLVFRSGSRTIFPCPDVALHGLKPEAETPPPRI